MKSTLSLIMKNINIGAYETAKSLCENALQEDRGSSVVWNLLGSCELALGNLQNAINCFTVSTEIDEKFYVAFNNLGTAHKRSDNNEVAIKYYKHALALNPLYAEAHNNVADCYLKVGKVESAVDHLRRALEIKPDYILPNFNMGRAHIMSQNWQGAVKYLNSYIKLNPKNPVAHNYLGYALKKNGLLVSAGKHYKRAIKLDPKYKEAINNLGNTYLQLNKIKCAINEFKKAIDIDNNCPVSNCNYARAFAITGEIEFALNHLKKCLSNGVKSANLLNDLGAYMLSQGGYIDAIQHFEHALELQPAFAEAHNNLGIGLKDAGKTESASRHFREAILHNPRYTDAYRNLSDIIKFDKSNDIFHSMLALSNDNSLTEAQQVSLFSALGKAFDDTNNYEKAFSYFHRSNLLRKKILKYNIKQDIDHYKNIFNRAKISHSDIRAMPLSDIKCTPIFIVGMPRSGTSLVEQVLSCHVNITGLGELAFVREIVSSLSASANITLENVAEFRERYLKGIEKFNLTTKFFIDKMPQNFLYLDFIQLAFPEAIIINTTRDARAVCWSNFRHLFTDRDLQYTHDLEDIVTYYNLYLDLMDLWKEYYPDRIIELNYEELTKNQEFESKRLLEKIGLPWDEACLYPEKNKRSVRTASQQQVRRPIYKGSSHAWLNYNEHLLSVFSDLRA